MGVNETNQNRNHYIFFYLNAMEVLMGVNETWFTYVTYS